MTHRESVGGIQDRMAEVRDWGVKLGWDGAEGGSKVINSLHLDTVCMSKQVVFTASSYTLWSKCYITCSIWMSLF